jgi:unsaturated rhamnogalacturonyl hydrolase
MKALLASLLFLAAPLVAQAPTPLSLRLADTIVHVFPNGRGDTWNYDEGTVLDGMDALWRERKRPEDLTYIEHCVDRFVHEDGTIRTYDASQLSLDLVLMGRQLLFLYSVTGKQKYRIAADTIYQQFQHQPRIPEGGFWHKQRYPNQMWLDSLYMAEPFYAEYAAMFHHPADFNDVEKQFALLEDHARDPKTGLLYHGWDESKKMPWADKTTGDSPSLWSRGMGWYAMGLVDVLDYLPADHPARAKMIARLLRFAKAVTAAQDADGLWWQIANKPGVKGNYEESSASAMFVYTLEKGVRKGYLADMYRAPAQKGYAAIIKRFLKPDASGVLHLSGTADAVGLGGEPYRDGSFAYYTSVPQVVDDARGLGAMLLAAVEMERPRRPSS